MIGGNSVAVHWIGVQSMVSLRSIGPKNACAIGLSNRRWRVGGLEFFIRCDERKKNKAKQIPGNTSVTTGVRIGGKKDAVICFIC